MKKPPRPPIVGARLECNTKPIGYSQIGNAVRLQCLSRLELSHREWCRIILELCWKLYSGALRLAREARTDAKAPNGHERADKKFFAVSSSLRSVSSLGDLATNIARWPDMWHRNWTDWLCFAHVVRPN